jgi:hypothetical protein
MVDFKEIGGYFALELPQSRVSFLHSGGILLNSGRNALEYILRSISDIRRLWIPYFTCDVILEPIIKLEIPYVFYNINEQLEIATDVQLQTGDYLLVTNYWGIKDTYVDILSRKYGKQLIVDNAQAFYAVSDMNIKTIYSPRKFVGVPDGGIAFIDNGLEIDVLEKDVSYERCSHLLKRMDLGANAGYLDFKKNSHKLANQPIRRMSNLTETILSSVDWENIRKKRIRNFQILHAALSASNNIIIPSIETFACPMVYPYLSKSSMLKKKMINNKIFVATYWPNVLNWCNPMMVEFMLADNLMAIPIDQRYTQKDMENIINLIKGNV